MSFFIINSEKKVNVGVFDNAAILMSLRNVHLNDLSFANYNFPSNSIKKSTTFLSCRFSFELTHLRNSFGNKKIPNFANQVNVETTAVWRRQGQ